MNATVRRHRAGGAAGRRRVAAPASAQNEQFIPILVYRTGAYAPNGIPFANGFADYFKLVNERDGGINGVKITFEECETGYATDRGVECYERLKGKGPTGAAYVIPLSTGITFALTEKAPVDKIPLHHHGLRPRRSRATARCSSGTSRCSAPTGRPPTSSCSTSPRRKAASTSSRARRSRWSITTRPTARSRSRCCRSARKLHGFELQLLPVTHPGVEQKATWLQIRQNRPDYVLLWGWGVMNSTAIKEAVAVGYPREKMYGVWWSGAEPDVRPAGDGAKGYNAVTLQHPSGQFKRARGSSRSTSTTRARASAKWEEIGEVLYNRGVINAMLAVEAIRTRAGEVRQEAADRRAGALGPREPRPDRRAHQGARLRGRAAADQGVLRRPRRARARAASRPGTARSGRSHPTGT